MSKQKENKIFDLLFGNKTHAIFNFREEYYERCFPITQFGTLVDPWMQHRIRNWHFFDDSFQYIIPAIAEYNNVINTRIFNVPITN